MKLLYPSSKIVLFLCFIYSLSFCSWSIYSKDNSGIPASDMLTALATDRTGNIWIGTFSNFLIKFDGVYWDYLDSSVTKIRSKSISYLFLDTKGNLWVAGNPMYSASAKTNGDLACFDGSTWKRIVPDSTGWPETIVTGMICDKNDKLWLSTLNGVVCFDGVQWKRFSSNNSRLPFSAFSAIACSPDNIIWLGTSSNGLIKMANDTSVEVFKKSNSSISSNAINSLAFDLSGTLWIGTDDSGVVSLTNSTFTKHTSSSRSPKFSPPGGRILGIDSTGALWASGTMYINKYLNGNWETQMVMCQEDNECPSEALKFMSVAPNGIRWFAGSTRLINGDFGSSKIICPNNYQTAKLIESNLPFINLNSNAIPDKSTFNLKGSQISSQNNRHISKALYIKRNK